MPRRWDTVFYGWGGPQPWVTQYTEGNLDRRFHRPEHEAGLLGAATATDVVDHPDSPNTAKLDKVVGQMVQRYPANRRRGGAASHHVGAVVTGKPRIR